MGKAPSAPNPVTTANAQTASNRETAITQAGLNLIDQTDALGNKLTHSQIGKWPDGTPRFSATQTLSPAQQAIANAGQATQGNLANLAQEQSGRLSGLLNEPLDWSTQQNYLNELTAQNLDPQWDRLAQQNEQALVNRGLRPGSTAYNAAQDEFLKSRSGSYNSANLNNFNSALQSQMALRNQPLNEILALSGQGQIQQPNFGATPQTGVAGTDVAGITQAGYQNQMQGYNANQSTLGGLFSAGASLIPLLSDRRAKSDIKRIGTADNGLGLYLYRYRTGGPFHVGVMADEVAAVNPGAIVTGDDGMMSVKYAEAFK